MALANKLDPALRVEGRTTYNGRGFKEFVPQRTAAYVDQVDNHIGELTVRETFDFAARCQGATHETGTRLHCPIYMLLEIARREKELGFAPDPDIDAFMKGCATKGSMHTVMTDYVLKILDLEVCADTVIGNEMMRGISGGQKKRVTTGEIIVGPKRALFMDEISTGLDSSTTFQIVTCIRNFVHLMEATVLVALLQPAPETYALCDEVLDYFSSAGFMCPERKNVADFLQEVTSRKDQQQYWKPAGGAPYRYVSPQGFSEHFATYPLGQAIAKELATAFDTASAHPDALVTTKYALGLSGILQVMTWREMILLKRNTFLFVFIFFQISTVGIITATTFLRTTLSTHSEKDGTIYLGAIFFSLIMIMFSGFTEMAIIIQRLSVFYKQRDNYFYPAWSFAAPTWILRIFNSLLESSTWTLIFYYVAGLAPEASRFFTFWLILFVIHQMAIALFRLISAICRSMTVANTFGSFMLLTIFILGGFILAKPDIPVWWVWGFWISPLAYAQNAMAVNEFTSPRWGEPYQYNPSETIGQAVLRSRGIFLHYYWVWLGIGALVGFAIVFNFLVVIALTFLSSLGKPQAVIPEDVLAEKQATRMGEPLSNTVSMRRSSDRKSMDGAAPAAAGAHTNGTATNGHGREVMRPTPEGKLHMPEAPYEDMEAGHEPTSKWDNFLEQTQAGDVAQGVMEIGEDEQPVTSHAVLAARDKFPSILSFASEGGEAPKRGMILPFQPYAMTFRNIWYYVTVPQGNDEFGIEKGGRLPLLRGISGAFRPGVLTALVGVSGAGKTTLMDVLSGRKTAGTIEGDIYVASFPKEQNSFARVSGYCEQTDTHSPCTTVREALIFSAWLRLPPEVSKSDREMFVDEVMELAELTSLRNALVGLPGVNGLSVEQRKRLTIAVELVANPSIIFMDEPTSGLDARAAAIVMRTVRNTVDTGRTVVCTIHQPSIDIFESFDELLLMKRGGQIIYNGELGAKSAKLVEYFQAIPGVPPCPDGYNPATWMLDISTQAMERKLGVDFAELYAASSVNTRMNARIEKLMQPRPGATSLHFDTTRARTEWTQYVALLWKNQRSYWKNPTYNTVRFVFTVAIAILFGSIFWNKGSKRRTSTDVFNVMGALYAATLFQGFSNGSAVQPVFAIERSVMYRERAAGMYSALPFAAAAMSIEVPYILIQSTAYSIIVYAMIHFEWTADKFFWFYLYMFLTLILFTFYGMMMVSLTPNPQAAAIVSSFFYGLWNLFSGFLIPEPSIPGWWVWFYYINPLAWVLYGMITSQLGNVKSILYLDDGNKEVRQYIRDYFGFHYSLVWLPAIILAAASVIICLITAQAIRKFNFQKR
eukprot:SM000060S19667  [mRNA]  locus=s60:404941:415471:- [translate_table: standard]